MKRFYFIFCLMIFVLNTYLFASISFSLGREFPPIQRRLSIEKENEIKKNKYGYIQINLPKLHNPDDFMAGNKVPESWELMIYINKEEFFFNTYILAGEKLEFPVPAGEIEILYSLSHFSNGYFNRNGCISYKTGNSYREREPISKIINLNVEESKTIILNVVFIEKISWGIGCLSCIPIPIKLQEIGLEQAVEERKGGDANQKNILKGQ